jgi:hypothetical protein
VLDNLIWHLLDVSLNLGVCEFTPNQSLGSKECVFWVNNRLTLCRDTN